MLTTHIARREAGEPDFFLISSYFSQRVPLVECNLCRRQLQRLIKYRDNPGRTAQWDYKLNIVSVVENRATFVSILGSLISLIWCWSRAGWGAKANPLRHGKKKNANMFAMGNYVECHSVYVQTLRYVAASLWLVSSWGHDSNMAVTGGGERACEQKSEAEAFRAHRLFVREEN